MMLPGFTAEASTGLAARAYGFAVAASTPAPGVVGAAFIGPLVFRCCRRAPLLGNRFVCVQQPHLP